MNEKQTILIVDDSEMNRALLIDILGEDYNFIEAEDGRKAVLLLKQNTHVDLMLLDITMPEMDGFQVLETMQKFHWIDEIPVIMISAAEDYSFVARSYDLGATDFIHRPFDAYIIRRRINNTLALYAKQKRLMQIVADQIYEKEKNNNLMISILSHIVEFRNSESADHVIHIRSATELLLRTLLKKTDAYNLTEADVALITTASALHDIGKIDIPESILNKPGRLTHEEFEIMKTHTTIGAHILEGLTSLKDDPLVKVAHDICRWHHERWDGRGYPDGLFGEQIPISAQVVALADVYDALTSERCYKAAFDHDTAIRMILRGECGAFSPLLLDCLQEAAPQLRTVFLPKGETYLTAREAERLTSEILNEDSMPRHDQSAQAIQSLQERLDFLASCSGGIQFEYDALSGLTTLTDWNSPSVDRRSVHDFSEAKNRRPISAKDYQRYLTALNAATQQYPEFSMSLMLPAGRDYHWFDMRVRTLWSPFEPGKLVGAVGQLTDAQRPKRYSTLRPNAPAAAETKSPADSDELSNLDYLQAIFDIVRFVDPSTASIMEVDDSGVLRRTEQSCYALWSRGVNCEDCIAARALVEKSTLCKLEFTDTEMFFVIAKYVCVNGTACIMELVSRVDGGRWIDANGTRLLLDRSRGEDRKLFQDPLTGAYSRRYFENYRPHLEGMEAVAIIDVDRFKHINDTYGHQIGDAALRDIALTIQSCIRGSDVLIRYGGDEFLLLFPRLAPEHLPAKEEQIQAAVSKIVMPEYPDVRLSVSIGGVSRVRPLEEAIRQADHLMYSDKSRLCTTPPVDPPATPESTPSAYFGENGHPAPGWDG